MRIQLYKIVQLPLVASKQVHPLITLRKYNINFRAWAGFI
jgi:hypothetical protein